MQPTEEQLKKFWEKCGFKQHTPIGYRYIYPDYRIAPLPPIDLNNLFKYAVPKLTKPELTYVLNDWNIRMLLFGQDPALALFWALYEVLNRH